MVGVALRLGKARFNITPAHILYIVAWAATVSTLYVIGPLFGIRSNSWATYYQALGKLLRIWGVLFGGGFALILFFLMVRSFAAASLRSVILRFTRIERIMIWLFLANAAWGIIGLLQGWPADQVAGDTLRGAFFPAIYWIVKKSIDTANDATALLKLILIGETVLLFILIPTDYIPFSFAGRTFLSTVFFTLLFEEHRVPQRLLYILILIFAFYAILTTSAQRGILLVFGVVIALNYYFRLREIKFTVLVFAFILPVAAVFTANDLLDLKIEKEIDVASNKFEIAVGARGRSRFFGLDESLFQRAGETIDVARTFASNPPYYLVTGFGNGAMLNNALMTPSERSVFKTQIKHNIYVTAVALMFRNGLIGLLLYVGIAVYIVRVLKLLRKHRDLVRDMQEFKLLKVVSLLHLASLLLSFVSYWYVGNVILALTLPLVEILRRDLVARVALAEAEAA